ncbi:hypothetical protein XA3_00930 [Xylocopilactobacillus apicola]|uniref:Uncharacterized protein n=1 Tax=Xylocopilactobacillus apicola TaxID=2932184 RepID=A0AAU9CUG8_9LACO|nr:hypothetical protein XA3_00930 [Xylocopilactobacillus apicola]
MQLDVDDEEPSSQAFNIEANCINKSKIELDRLMELDADEVDKFIQFVNMKLLNIKEYPDEYNDNGDVLIEKLPFYKTFLVSYLIEFFFLKNDPKGLDVYLKAIRVPGLKKYSAGLKDIYRQL